jgi:hypothetical protein
LRLGFTLTEVIGKRQYRSLEMVSNLPYNHDSELFSLGATLFELATGCQAYPRFGIGGMKAVILSTNIAAKMVS